MEKVKKILFITNIFYSDRSGSIAARSAAKIFDDLGYKVIIFANDKIDMQNIDSITSYEYVEGKQFTWRANFDKFSLYKNRIVNILDEYDPDLVFFFDNLSSIPLPYFLESFKRRNKTALFLLLQDFYCTKYHATLNGKQCEKCINGTGLNSLIYFCGKENKNERKIKKLFHILYSFAMRPVYRYIMKKCDFVIGSSAQQLNFYKLFGVQEDKTLKVPLFFDQKRIESNNENKKVGDYFVVSGQAREEKGMQYIAKILENSKDIKIKIPFEDKRDADNVIQIYELQKYIDQNKLEMIYPMSWLNGGKELFTESLGVLIPTVWCTTTEFVLLESLGLSKPIVTFNSGIHAEIIQHGYNGFVHSVNDINGIVRSMRMLKEDSKIRNDISKNAYQLYLSLTSSAGYKESLRKFSPAVKD